jgi:predicted nucleotidyltransferase
MTLADLPLQFDAEEIARFCEDSGIRRLSFFGSVLRDDFTPASDVDMLVEYMPGRHPGLMLFRQQEELASRLKRTVDLHTPASLSRHFRDKVLAHSLAIYERS